MGTVKSVISHKHLGLILDEKIAFENHLKDKIDRANKVVGVIKALFYTLPRKALLNIYTSFIRPHFDYCDIIYHKSTSDELSIFDYEYNIGPNKRSNDMIESVQHNAALAITGYIRGTCRDKIYKELGIMSLYDRRRYRRLTFFDKIKYDKLPNYLKLLIPDELAPTNHNLRRRQKKQQSYSN